MKKLNTIFAISSLLLSTSCSQFTTGRSYLSEMEHDDSTFFNPNEDFPVVAGDNGQWGHTKQDIRARTPASEEDKLQVRERYALKEELRRLEDQLEGHALTMYDNHKEKIGSTSEKIYYLGLPLHERREYLESRGILENPAAGATPQEKYFGLRPTTIGMGMSKDDVMESFGKPVRVEIAGNPSYENERWLYNVNGSKKFIYFESGRVEGWE